jgi:hypothetical protein
MTSMLSGLVVGWAKLLPVLAFGLIWMFFSGSRTILRAGEERFLRELLLCLSCFGLFFFLVCFGCYGLVDPANHFARPGALPPTPAELARFAQLGYASLAVGVVAGVLLEWRIRRA